MDPMDYTMDDEQGQSIQNNNTPGCNQYNQPHQSPSMNTFPRVQNAHHYDPVHNTDSWFSQNRPQQFPNTHTPQQYSMPNTQSGNWQGFGPSRGGMNGDGYNEGPNYRNQPAFGAISNANPWSDYRGYEPFGGYSGHMLPASQDPSPSMADSLNSRSVLPLLPPVSSSEPPQPNTWAPPATWGNTPVQTEIRREISTRHRENREGLNRANDGSHGHNSLREEAARLRADARDARNARQANLASSAADFTPSQPVSTPPHPRRRFSPTDYASSLAGDWQSENEFLNYTPYDRDRIVAHMRYHEAIMQYAHDDENTIAVLRAAGAGKKIPSREALDSMEKVPLESLGESEKSCIICYNDFGVENPEGITEHPLRLPKCKHIFGDRCIKKWFDDKDTCPYCRDKLPSEKSSKIYSQAFEALTARQRERASVTAMNAAVTRTQPSRRSITGELTALNAARHAQELDHPYHPGPPPPLADHWSSHSSYRTARDMAASERRRSALREHARENQAREQMREQMRLRGVSGGSTRPTSLNSSSRLSNPTPSPYPHSTPNSNTPHPRTAPTHRNSGTLPSHFRPSTPPGLSRQSSEGSFTSNLTSNNSNSNSASPSSQEASPAVVSGAGGVHNSYSHTHNNPFFVPPSFNEGSDRAHNQNSGSSNGQNQNQASSTQSRHQSNSSVTVQPISEYEQDVAQRYLPGFHSIDNWSERMLRRNGGGNGNGNGGGETNDMELFLGRDRDL